MMHRRQDWLQETKTISTNQSVHQLSIPQMHTFHRYQTLLNFFVSFLTDFQIQLAELKNLTYSLVGAQIWPFGSDLLNKMQADCEYCEVQFMMSLCRTTRQDIVRVSSLLRGYIKSVQKISRVKDILSNQTFKEEQRASNLNIQNIDAFYFWKGTNLIEQKVSNHKNPNNNNFNIIQQKPEVTESDDELMACAHDQILCYEGQQNYTKSDNPFNKAYQLISKIKAELREKAMVPHVHLVQNHAIGTKQKLH